MRRNNDDIEQGKSPITPPEGDIEEQELYASEPILAPVPESVPEPVVPESVPEPVPAPDGKWDWVGSSSRPEAREEEDGISDLFRVTPEDVGASEEDLSDLTDVDIEKDVLDADANGSLDDLVVVTEADIMGDDKFGQRPSKSASRQSRSRRRMVNRYLPPTSLGGVG